MPDQIGPNDPELQKIALLLTRDRIAQIEKETSIPLTLEGDGTGYNAVTMAGRTVVGAMPPTALLDATTSILILIQAGKSKSYRSFMPKSPQEALRALSVSGRTFTAEVEPNPHS